jgi:hypothetical protein
MESKVKRLSTGPLQVFSSLCLSLLAAGLLGLATGQVLAQEFPPQRWAYEESADVVTGDLYPAASLMSPKVVKASANATGVGHGYLSVGNYSKRPMEVTLALDEPLSRSGASNCKPSGCELSVRFGTAPAMKFIAFQDKYFSTLVLQDGSALIAAAKRHIGPIEVEIQTLRYGLVAVQFATATRLQTERLNAAKR